jgi:cytochrome c oxidase subunit III
VADLAAHAVDGLHPPGFAHQFEDMDQQRDAGNFGMWVFLATEVLFFGGLFMGYTVYRAHFPAAFAEGSRHLNIHYGASNTAILIASSLTMALAIHSAQVGKRKPQVYFLILTIILGALFLFLKFNYEWTADYREGLIPGFGFRVNPDWPQASSVQLFFCFYFFMTGLHALHMIVGIGILVVLTVMAARGRFNEHYYAPLENCGLYWHFVDIVWIFLFPLLYLAGGRYAIPGVTN